MLKLASSSSFPPKQLSFERIAARVFNSSQRDQTMELKVAKVF